MGSKGGFILLWLLSILAVLCHFGHSLQCYNCINPAGSCTTAMNCSHNQDACIFVEAVPPKTYYQCWRFDECNFDFISRNLGEKKLKYNCCQKDLCNKSDATILSGKTAPLVILLLVATWHFCL
ncbi:CD59 glycoprotein [Phacochoerus africanus]|uniref:CD59 glycoprotein n=1 Tax=Phacochoerus africanus TaxID=41426 RepID=UPI001FD8A68B|nr:CD59 glycoprotein [Phacochoerus africanus]XP_047631989.1 CD59 glycoprotein [Phacochoerus africanus]XP_047631990.1 CD59 glycoprotein [Phacochoerus africanus]